MKLVIIMTLFLLLSDANANDSNIYLIGKFNYQSKRIVTSNVDGIVNKINIKSGQKISDDLPIAEVTPFDPNIKKQLIFAGSGDYVVSEVMSREGVKVDKYQPILSLARRADLNVRAISYYPNNQYVNIGKKVTVILDPDGYAIPLNGEVDAIHNRHSELGGVSKSEVEIKLDTQTCFVDETCNRLFRFGSLVKVQLNKSKAL
ncbi:HlyD family efflux transporter periplasmic adaptor subunit [Pseudoalteromonas luteoviolacea]|nr:HlyD family efflux transporter periplasmic adaptor subunit [Pseudoalteromonas luteoviolacea]